MKHFASPAFWAAYDKLPAHIRELADRITRFSRATRSIPRFISRGSAASGRCESGSDIALAVQVDEGLLWFWIGSHADYDAMIG